MVGLAIWLEPAELGRYGLVMATVTLAVIVVGLDFYTVLQRDLDTETPGTARRQIRDQAVLLTAVHLLAAPILVLLMAWFGIDRTIILLALLLTVFQHISLECWRLLLRLQHQIQGSIVFFLREAAWIPFCALAAIWYDLSVATVFGFALTGAICASMTGIALLHGHLPRGARGPLDIVWLKQGLRTALRFLVGTISLRGLFTADRFAMAALTTPETLGAYVFFTSLAGACTSLFDTGILPFHWPKLLAAAKRGDWATVRQEQTRLNRVCLIGGVVIPLIVLGAGISLALLLETDTYEQSLFLLLPIAIGYGLMTLSNAPHYQLYAARHDTQNVLANITATGVFAVTVVPFSILSVPLATPLAFCSAMAALFGLKSWLTRRITLEP